MRVEPVRRFKLDSFFYAEYIYLEKIDNNFYIDENDGHEGVDRSEVQIQYPCRNSNSQSKQMESIS